MLENFDSGAGKSEPENERGVVQLVTDNQTPLADQPGQVQAVGGETHANSNGIFNAKKLCHCFLQLSVDCEGSNLKFVAKDCYCGLCKIKFKILLQDHRRLTIVSSFGLQAPNSSFWF